jgi:hypothetical protein
VKFLQRFLPALAAACLISTAALADDNPPPPPHGDHGPGGPGGPGEMMKFLGPEAHMMLFERMHNATAGMNEQQRHDYMDKQMSAIKAMSAADKQKFAASLKAEWDTLPTARQNQIKKEMEEMRTHRPGGPGGPAPQ